MLTTMCLTCRAALIAEWLRARLTPSRAVVDLVDGQSNANGAYGSAREGYLPRWRRDLLRRRYREREANPYKIHMVQDHPTSCHWEQAFSPDGGKTWETNWVQDLNRVQ